MVQSNFTARGRYGSIVSTVLIGRDQSGDLRRHTYPYAYQETSPWRLPSCFAAMLFCDDTVSRGRCYGSIVQSREL